ncbi:MAG: aldo/keto reductase [Candidatus Eiseniibacteriota bacterium]
MNYRKLGRSGTVVSEVGLGTWPIGGSIVLGDVPTGYGRVSESEAVGAVRRALDKGVTLFDTSDAYGLGRAERFLGQAVSGRRGQVVVATKIGWVPDGKERWIADLSSDHLRAAATRSRARLGVDVIDLLQLHAVPAPGDETERALDALDELKTMELCRLTGVSVGADWEAGLRLARSDRIDAVQVHYNLLQQGAAQELLDDALVRGVGIIASAPLAHGFLSGKREPGETFPADDWRSRFTAEERAARVERVRELEFLGGAGRRTMVQAALQFVLAHPAVSSAIPGFRSVEQVEDLVAAQDVPRLSDIEVARARDLARVRRSPALADR